MKASDYIAERIAREGIKVVFGYQGGNIAHTIDSIGLNPNLKFVATYNEQGAAFAACGYALENETIGVALASSGPGAINLISGIANAYYDSIPTLFFTGNVSLHTMKKSEEIRQNAFQENDIVSMVSKITKYAVTVTDIHELKYHLEKAIYLAKEGRPGPVLLDLPHNIQKESLNFDAEKGYNPLKKNNIVNDYVLGKVIKIIESSHRPLLVVGGGAYKTSVKAKIHQLLCKWSLPVVSTLRGMDVVSHYYENYIGFGGAYGTRTSNLAMKYADTIIILGARLDERFLCTQDKALFEKKNIVHVDIDPIELNRVVKSEISIQSDLSDFLDSILSMELLQLNLKKWNGLLHCWKERFPTISDVWSINRAIYELTKSADDTATISLDVGINQMCAAQSMVLSATQRCYTSAGHGAMGCSLPTAIGASYANRNKIIDCYVGDGALHMNIQELLMLSRDNLPVHVILNNNQCLGMIRDFQTKAFESRFTATVDELHQIDYAKIAEAYKLPYYKVCSIDGLDKAKELIGKKEPCFIEILFEETVDTSPKLGLDMFNQLPTLTDAEKELIEREVMML